MTPAELSQRPPESDLSPNLVVEPESLQAHVLGTYLTCR